MPRIKDVEVRIRVDSEMQERLEHHHARLERKAGCEVSISGMIRSLLDAALKLSEEGATLKR